MSKFHVAIDFTTRGRPLIALAACLLIPAIVQAQAGMRESLQRLDKNENGRIEPDEITPLARPYLEKIARARRISLRNSPSIDQLLDAGRIYHAFKNGVWGTDIESDRDGKLREFGPDDGAIPPEFGLPRVGYPYNREDLDKAQERLDKYDRDQDGMLDYREARRASWSRKNPFDMDYNGDNKLSKVELAQRYARRRLLEDSVGELIKKAVREAPPREDRRQERGEDGSNWWRKGGKSHWLAAGLMGRFDVNRNGTLDRDEAEKLNLPLAEVDADQDGKLTRDELLAFLTPQQDAALQTEGAPEWFLERDADGDGQVAMVEFTDEWNDELLTEFAQLDTDGDGFVTRDEAMGKGMAPPSYPSARAKVIAPFKTLVSEIEVFDDIPIENLSVELTITHTYISYLDAFLTAPDGRRVELFTNIGGSNDNFEKTIFDDTAETPIAKGRSPYQGRHQPEALTSETPGLEQFKGASAKGTWQLSIRGTRNSRHGMLHNWKLYFQPHPEPVVKDEENEDAPADAQPSSDAANANEEGEKRRAQLERYRIIFAKRNEALATMNEEKRREAKFKWFVEDIKAKGYTEEQQRRAIKSYFEKLKRIEEGKARKERDGKREFKGVKMPKVRGEKR